MRESSLTDSKLLSDQLTHIRYNSSSWSNALLAGNFFLNNAISLLSSWICNSNNRISSSRLRNSR